MDHWGPGSVPALVKKIPILSTRSYAFEVVTRTEINFSVSIKRQNGGAVAQSVECATPGEEVKGSIPAVAARSLLVGSV